MRFYNLYCLRALGGNREARLLLPRAPEAPIGARGRPEDVLRLWLKVGPILTIGSQDTFPTQLIMTLPPKKTVEMGTDVRSEMWGLGSTR